MSYALPRKGAYGRRAGGALLQTLVFDLSRVTSRPRLSPLTGERWLLYFATSQAALSLYLSDDQVHQLHRIAGIYLQNHPSGPLTLE